LIHYKSMKTASDTASSGYLRQLAAADVTAGRDGPLVGELLGRVLFDLEGQGGPSWAMIV
jgi:hypothetical protein